MIHFLGQFDPIWHSERYISDALEWWGEDVQDYDIASPFDRPGKNGNPPVGKGDVVLISQPQRFSGVSKRATGRLEHLDAWRAAGAKTVCWYFDWIRDFASGEESRESVYVPALQRFDLVCSTDGYDDSWYRERNINRKWLPQAAPQDARPYPARQKPAVDRNILFIGSVYTPERKALLEKLTPLGLNIAHGRGACRIWGAEFARLCASSRIVLGDNYRNDIPGYWSDRVYRVLAAGGFLLTPRVPGLSDHFTDGAQLAMYDNADDALAQAVKWLEKSNERARIALDGMRHVQREQTYIHRTRQLLDLIDGIGKTTAVAVGAPEPTVEVKGPSFKLGMLGYTNHASGIGLVNADLFKWLPYDSVLSCYTYKGQERWHEQQIDARVDNLMRDSVIRYLQTFKPDVLLSVETFYCGELPALCAKYKCKAVIIPMHEVYNPGMVRADLWICPNQICYGKVREVNKVLWRLPMDGDGFPFTPRHGRARSFGHNFGYGFTNNKRQIDKVIAGFRANTRQDITLTISVQDAQHLKKYGYPTHVDRRIRFREGNQTPADAYAGIDVLVQPEAYAGYGRVVLEAQLCGIPVITTNAAPMNEYAVDRDLLIRPYSSALLAAPPFNAQFNLVSGPSVAAAIGKALDLDLTRKSAEARANAEQHLWTRDKADALMQTLGELLD